MPTREQLRRGRAAGNQIIFSAADLMSTGTDAVQPGDYALYDCRVHCPTLYGYVYIRERTSYGDGRWTRVDDSYLFEELASSRRSRYRRGREPVTGIRESVTATGRVRFPG